MRSFPASNGQTYYTASATPGHIAWVPPEARNPPLVTMHMGSLGGARCYDCAAPTDNPPRVPGEPRYCERCAHGHDWNRGTSESPARGTDPAPERVWAECIYCQDQFNVRQSEAHEHYVCSRCFDRTMGPRP